MKKIILTKGLPASGKSTWAKQYQADNHNTVRVNKDELRAMLHDSVWSRGREQFILKVRDFIVEESLKEGHDVIIDDTNLHSKHKNQMWHIGSKYNAVIEVKDFTDIPVEECIKRDLKRPNSVGAKVIKNMYNQFLRTEPIKQIFDKSLPSAIICDIDGTLALFEGKNPYDRDFINDDINEPVRDILRRYSADKCKIVLVSGRKGKALEETKLWLVKHGIFYDEIHMPRAEGDDRKDIIIKTEIYEEHIKGKYNVLFVLDDRDQVVDLWRSLGLTCLQVNYGDF